MNEPIRVLYVDDYPLDRELVRDALEREHGGFQVIEAASRQEFETRLAEGGYDLVLSDFNILGFEGLEVIDAVWAKDPRVPVVIVTGTGTEEVAAEAMRRGAADYVIKTPHHIRQLPHTIQAAIEKKRLRDERKRAEEALRESEARYRAVVEDQTELICRFQPDGTLTFVNEAYCRYFGKRREELVGYSCMPLIPEEDRESVRQQMASLSVENPTVTYEHRVILPDGQIRWQQWSDRAIFDEQGRLVEYQSVGRDITERKRVEEMKDNLIRDVSHELKTPLAKMQVATDMLTRVIDAPSIDRQKVTRTSEIVAGNVQRLQRTVNGILDLSSLESGQTPYHKTKVQPGNLIGQVILDMQSQAQAKGLELVAELPEGLPQVEGDREKLLHVLTNLVDNAVKFSDQGKIVISAEKKAHEVEIAVSDSGRGILRENLDRVFERFWQENPSIPGVGIGLAICKAIVEAHGGKIWAESAGRGQSATVRFTLPVG